MAEYSYNTRGVCSRKIDFEIEDGIVKNVRFLGGCNGNLQGIGKLVEGMKIEEVIENYDVMGIVGNGASYEILKSANASKADIVIAATSSDETNILACLIGKKIGAKSTIARVRNFEYIGQSWRTNV